MTKKDTTLYVPLKLNKFEVISPKYVKPQQVIDEISRLNQWMFYEETEYYTNEFQNLVDAITNDPTRLTSHSSASGRAYGVLPGDVTSQQAYNTSEMFRANIMMKVAGYLQSEQIVNIILSQDSPTPNSIIKQFKTDYPDYSAPKFEFVRQTLDRIPLVAGCTVCLEPAGFCRCGLQIPTIVRQRAADATSI